MRRLLILFPRRWRQRYGEEYAALLEELRPTPAVVADTIRAAVRARLADRLAMTVDPAQTGGPAMAALTLDVRDRLPQKTPFGLIAIVVLLPAAVFLTISVMKYGLGIPGPFDALEPFYLAGRPVEYATFLAPFVALLVATIPIFGLRVERDAGVIRTILEVDARPLNVAVALLSALVAAAFLAYLFAENVLGRMHVESLVAPLVLT
jgi:hypothetical protein